MGRIQMTVMEQKTTIRSLVLAKIRELEPRPTQLIRELCTEAYPSEIENSLSELLDEGAVIFGSDGRLRVAETFAHAS
jgi:hypothetical protein